MKRNIWIIVLILFQFHVYAKDLVTELMSKKESSEGVMSVSISGKMLRVLAENDPKVDKDFKQLAKDIDQIKMVSNMEVDEADRKELKKLLKPYEELMVVSEADGIVSMYTKEEKGKITEFVVCFEADDVLLLMSIAGNIDLKKLSKLAKTIKIDGMKHLRKLDEK